MKPDSPAAAYHALIPISGLRNPEDLIELPGTPWVIVSSMRSADGTPGRLYAVDSRSQGAPIQIYPAAQLTVPPVTHAGKESCSPPDPRTFFPHGINLRALPDGSFELLVVNHGGRESVEMLRIHPQGSAAPQAVWTGCVLLPPHTFGNGIAPVPGGFVISNMYDPTDPGYLEKFAKAQITGDVLLWTRERGWAKAVDQSFSGANGVEVSPDGKWLYVSEWSARRLWRLPLHGGGPARSVPLDFLPDNLRWSPSGTLILAGQRAPAEQVFGCEARGIPCPLEFEVMEVDPQGLDRRTLLRGGDSRFGGATGATLVGEELWVGSYRGDTVAWYSPAR